MESGLVQVLADTLDPRGVVRTAAEQKLQRIEAGNLAEFVNLLIFEFGRTTSDPFIRQAAAIRLKNCFSAKDLNIDAERKEAWKTLPVGLRTTVKDSLLVNLLDPNVRVSSTAAQLIALVGIIELPVNEWPTLLPALLRNVSSDTLGDAAKVATAAALTYLSEETAVLAEETGCIVLPESRVDDILTALVQGTRHANDAIKLEATKGLYHALIFARRNFDNEKERNYIFTVVLENCKGDSEKVRAASLGCLVQIAAEYYEHLGDAMNAAAQVTFDSMQGGDEGAALAAMEFWTSVCEEELCLKERGKESRGYMLAVLPHFLPILLKSLIRQEGEDADMDVWTLAMAAGTCLSLLATLIEDMIIEPVMKFADENFGSCDWHRREAAVLAYGSILSGPSKNALSTLLANSVPSLLGKLGDPSIAVRDTAAWALGRVASLHPRALMLYLCHIQEKTQEFFDLLASRLADAPRVAVNACWVLSELHLHPEAAADTGLMTDLLDKQFKAVAVQLVQTGHRADAEERSLRDGAFHALTSVIGGVSQTCEELIFELLSHLVEKLELSLRFDPCVSQRNYQGLVCGAVQICVVKLGQRSRPLLRRVWVCLHAILTAPEASSLSEDALLATSAVIAVLQEEFEPCMAELLPCLLRGLNHPEEVSTCKIVIELVGDCSRALGLKFTDYSIGILPVLFSILADGSSSRNLKPSSITAVVDVAMTIGVRFTPFVESFLSLLVQASQTQLDMGPTDDEEWLDYFNSLRDAVLQSYSSVIYALRDGNNIDVLKPHVNEMLQLCSRVTNEPLNHFSVHNFNAAIGLVVDLVGAFGPPLVTHLKSTPFVSHMLTLALTNAHSGETRSRAQLLKRALATPAA